MRQIWKKCAAWILTGAAATVFCSCGVQPDETAEAAEAIEVSAVNPEKYFDREDAYTDWRNESSVYTVLSGTTAQTSGSGIAVRDGQILIDKAGTYVLEGSFQGSMVVDADNSLVRLVLNGVQMQASDGPAVCVRQADKVILSLEPGKENVLSDSERHSVEEEDAAVYSKDDLVINGEGTLTINGNYLDGLKSKDKLNILSGNLKINAKDDGLIGKDCVVIQTAQMDGVYTIGGYQKGKTVLSFSMESGAVYLNESGVTTQPNGGMGGRGGQPEGRQNKPDGEQNPNGMPPREGGGRGSKENRMPPSENGQQMQ